MQGKIARVLCKEVFADSDIFGAVLNLNSKIIGIKMNSQKLKKYTIRLLASLVLFILLALNVQIALMGNADNFLSNLTVTTLISEVEAQTVPGSGGGEIICRCDGSIWETNEDCLASNSGNQCAPDGTEQCQTYNSNCGSD